MFQNASSLKPLGQLKPNCPEMIIGRSSTNLMISTLIFDFFLLRGDLYKYPMKNILKTAKFLTTWGLSQMYFPGL
jgi:hypothetical protein